MDYFKYEIVQILKLFELFILVTRKITTDGVASASGEVGVVCLQLMLAIRDT